VKTLDYLPTETEREYAARRARYESILTDYADGKIATVDDLITYNLDLEAFAEDWLRGATADQVRAFYQALTRLTVLDPTCGSGAFLFAAIQILEPLYDVALERMAHYQDTLKHNDFVSELAVIDLHPSRRYFILKRIIVNNLYGVDIMPEAVEICKLRLFLKLAAQVNDAKHIEPLPDIDFNIRAGNTLVGFATKDEIAPSHVIRMYDTQAVMAQVVVMEGTLRTFRRAQLNQETTAEQLRTMKTNIQRVQATIRDQLDVALMEEYGQKDLANFRASHQPFHWYVEFHHVVGDGGFDVIVGNPPYVEYSKVRKEYEIRGYKTEKAGNLYAMVCERCFDIGSALGRQGLIVPLSLVSTERMRPLQELLINSEKNFWLSNFDVYPTKLFDGAKQRLTIYITSGKANIPEIFASIYHRWRPEAREQLFPLISYAKSFFDEKLSVFPKMGSNISKFILQKVSQMKPAIFRTNAVKPSFYVHRIPYNYIKAFDFIPYFWNEVDGQKKSEDYKPYELIEVRDVPVMIGVLNSTLFFWWWYILFEGYHCGKHEIFSFPIGLEKMSEDVKTNLSAQAKLLMSDFQNKAGRKVANYKTTGRVEYDEFYPSLSKPIIDEIDRVLAQHYGFTEEELDFIINYDIKYRMGRDAESGDDEGGE
jgi:hypothetical protein